MTEEWQRIEDIRCESFDKVMMGFRVDRLRPNWGYRFAVGQVDANGKILTLSKPIDVVTPADKSVTKSYSWVWWILGLGGVGVLIWLLKKYQSTNL